MQRDEHVFHKRVHRPGNYEPIDEGTLSGEAADGQSWRLSLAADASSSRRALDRGQRHGE